MKKKKQPYLVRTEEKLNCIIRSNYCTQLLYTFIGCIVWDTGNWQNVDVIVRSDWKNNSDQMYSWPRDWHHSYRIEEFNWSPIVPGDVCLCNRRRKFFLYGCTAYLYELCMQLFTAVNLDCLYLLQ